MVFLRVGHVVTTSRRDATTGYDVEGLATVCRRWTRLQIFYSYVFDQYNCISWIKWNFFLINLLSYFRVVDQP